MAIPPTAANRKRLPVGAHESLLPTAVATATWYVVSAVASLSSPSPSINVINRTGSRARRPTDSAATGSGGAAAAPSATAAASGNSGRIADTAPPTANAVAITSSTDSEITGRMEARIAIRLEFSAAE